MGSNRWLRNSFVYLLVIIGVIVIFYTLLPGIGGGNELPITTVISMAKNNEIREIIADGKKLTVVPEPGSRVGNDRFTSRVGTNTEVMTLLVESGVAIGPPNGVTVNYKGGGGLGSVFGLLINFLPLIFFGGLILFMMRQAKEAITRPLVSGAAKRAWCPSTAPR